MTRIIVERVDRMSSRPWLFVTGRLEGEPLRVGDELRVISDENPPTAAVIRAIEFHTRPGKTTIAVDGELSSSVTEGTVLVRD